MSYFNPAKMKIKALESRINNTNVVKEESNKEIISINDILEKKEEIIEISVIDNVKNAIITGIPRTIFLSANSLGNLSVLSDNENIQKSM